MAESGFLKSFFKGRGDDETANEGTRAEERPEMNKTTDSVAPPAEGADMAPETSPETSPKTSAETGSAPEGDGKQDLKTSVIDALSQIYDPEIPVNIYELGLIYDVQVADNGDVQVIMTLTTPHCPVAESMPGEVETRVRDVVGVNDVKVELVWDPPWDMTMMSEAARLELGFL